MVDESSFKIERNSTIKGSRRVLEKVLLFQLDGRGHPQDDATPSFFPDSKNSIRGLFRISRSWVPLINESQKIVGAPILDLEKSWVPGTHGTHAKEAPAVLSLRM